MHGKIYSIFIFLLIGILVACGSKENKQPDTPDSYYRSDLIYFGEMNYFPETNEFYTTIYLYPDYKSLALDSLSQLTDSTIVEREGVKRRKLPIHLARRYFLIFDIDSVSIFDSKQSFLSKAFLKRIEYFQNETDCKFIAVYEAQHLIQDPVGEHYCVANENRKLLKEGFSSRIIHDETLNEFIMHKLNIAKSSVFSIVNMEIKPYNATYSVVTNQDASFITELKDNDFKIIKKLNSTYRIEKILPLPYEVNGKPLLLSSLYVPGIGGSTTSLLVCNNIEEYRILSFNRLKYK